MAHLHPVLLCGGSGTRLWPLSRKSFPKQFTRLVGEETLFQAAAGRMTGPDVAKPLIVITSSDFRFIVTEQLAEGGIDPGPILIEPAPRNTAPAVLAAALHLHETDPDALMLVMPSDHVIPDAEAFRAAVAAGVAAAKGGQHRDLRHPARPGRDGLWLARAGGRTGWRGDRGRSPRTRFVEKPDAARAEEMLAQGRYPVECGHLPDVGQDGACSLRDPFARSHGSRARRASARRAATSGSCGSMRRTGCGYETSRSTTR